MRLRELLGSCLPQSCLEEQRLQEVPASDVRSLDAAATHALREKWLEVRLLTKGARPKGLRRERLDVGSDQVQAWQK